MRAKGILFLVIAVLCAAVVYVGTRTDATGSNIGTTTFALTIENREITDGPTLLRVDEGETVIINVTADEREELHLHGYDRSVDLEPGVPSSLTFVADASGRFPFELEISKTELGAIEVMP